MEIINVRNVNQALPRGVDYLTQYGLKEQSRNGAVLVAPGPVCTIYHKPWERVLFDPTRDANPFFHFFESLWMLVGRNDVEFPAHFAANIRNFSDDGTTVAGAYGHRWRARFGYDQLQTIIEELKTNPQTRRCVLAMWNPEDELLSAIAGSKDVCCNTHVYFDTVGGVLNMTVCCRSNDMVWGAYGANVVHFSMLHEYVTRASGLQPGVYRQFSNNFHAYIERPDTAKLFQNGVKKCDEYAAFGLAMSYPLFMKSPEGFDKDLKHFFHVWAPNARITPYMFSTSFFNHVVAPMWNVHKHYKDKNFNEAMMEVQSIAALDWCTACTNWLLRRMPK